MNKSDLSQLPNYCTATAIGSIVSTESVGHRRYRCCIYSHTHTHTHTHTYTYIHMSCEYTSLCYYFLLCAHDCREKGFFKLIIIILFCFVFIHQTIYSVLRRYYYVCDVVYITLFIWHKRRVLSYRTKINGVV
jgi:hypothetical protein